MLAISCEENYHEPHNDPWIYILACPAYGLLPVFRPERVAHDRAAAVQVHYGGCVWRGWGSALGSCLSPRAAVLAQRGLARLLLALLEPRARSFVLVPLTGMSVKTYFYDIGLRYPLNPIAATAMGMTPTKRVLAPDNGWLRLTAFPAWPEMHPPPFSACVGEAGASFHYLRSCDYADTSSLRFGQG
jgi:hypothetical protein